MARGEERSDYQKRKKRGEDIGDPKARRAKVAQEEAQRAYNAALAAATTAPPKVSPSLTQIDIPVPPANIGTQSTAAFTGAGTAPPPKETKYGPAPEIPKSLSPAQIGTRSTAQFTGTQTPPPPYSSVGAQAKQAIENVYAEPKQPVAPQSYWEQPDTVVNWYSQVMADPATTLPEGMTPQTIKGIYENLKYNNKGLPPAEWKPLPEGDPMLGYVRTIPNPALEFLTAAERKLYEPRPVPKPGSNAQTDPYAPDFDIKKLSIEQKREILGDPNFHVSKVTAPGQQGLILSDPEFGLWEKAGYGGVGPMAGRGAGGGVRQDPALQWWQPVAYSVLSNPKSTPLMQGLALTVMTGGKGALIAAPMVALGYGAQSEDEFIRVTSETLLKPFMWGAEKTEQLAGLSSYLSTGTQRLGHASYTPEELKEVKERTAVFMEHPQEVFDAMKVFYETTAGQEVWVLGEAEKVQVKPGYTLEDAVDRILKGASSGEILADYQREYGVSGIASDFLYSAVYDPLNAAPDVAGAVKGGIAKTKAGLAATRAAKLAGDVTQTKKVTHLEARVQIETMKAQVVESAPGVAGEMFGGVSEVGKKWREIVKKSPNVAEHMTKIERAVAGVTPEGAIKEILDRPLTMTVGSKEIKIPKFIERTVTLQPKVKARMFLDTYASQVGQMVDWNKMIGGDVSSLVDTAKAVARLDPVALKELGAEHFNTPEAYTTALAARDLIPKLERAKATFDAAAPNRSLFAEVANILEARSDKQKTKLLKTFLNGDPRSTFKAFEKKLRLLDTPEAKTLIGEIDAGRLNVDVMKKTFEPFRDGKVALTVEDFGGTMLNLMDEHMKTWGKDYFELKHDNIIDDSLRLLKGSQSLLLLDLSPQAIINDFVNERVMMATSGTLGLDIGAGKWIDEFGLAPKEVQFEKFGEAAPRKDTIGQLTKGKTPIIGSVADALNKGRSLLLRPKASEIFNAMHHDQIFASQTKAFMDANWKPGVGFEKMSPSLEAKLTAAGIDPKSVYSNMRHTMDAAKLEVMKGATNADVGVFIDHAATVLGRDAGEVSTMLTRAGVYDSVKAALAEAKTPTERVKAFEAIENKVLENFDARQAEGLKNLIEQNRNAIATEKAPGVVKLFQDIALDGYERKIETDFIWDDAFAKSELVDDYGLRQQVKAEAAAKADAAWRRTQARQSALYNAAVEGLGMDTEFKRAYLADLGEQHKILRDVYEYRSKEVQKFFDATFDTPEARTQAWYDLELKLDEKFDADLMKVNRIQEGANGKFVGEMGRTFGDGGAAMARNWLDPVMRNTLDLHKANSDFRKSILGKTAAERAKAQATWKPKYQKMWAERMGVDMNGSANLYKWDTVPPETSVKVDPAVAVGETMAKYDVQHPNHLLAIVKKYLGAEAAEINTTKQLTPDLIDRAMAIRDQVKASQVEGALPPTEAAQTIRFEELTKSLDDALAKQKPLTQAKSLTALDAEMQKIWAALPDDINPATLEKLAEIQLKLETTLAPLKRDIKIAEALTAAQKAIKEQEAFRVTGEPAAKTNTLDANLKRVQQTPITDNVEMPLYPPGGYEQSVGYVDYTKFLEDGYVNEVRPVLNEMKNAAGVPEKGYSFESLDPATQAELKAYLKDSASNLSKTKAQAKGIAEAQSEYALLDYGRQYGFDKPLSAGVPYEFFNTRSGAYWLARVADKPAWISQYARYKQLSETYESQLPERTRDKIWIPMPLPEWTGGGVWINPDFQTVPYTQYIQPLIAMRRDQEQLVNQTFYVLRDMAEGGVITEQEAQKAMDAQAGPIWERALAQAEIGQGEKSTAGDYYSMLLGPALYATVPYYLATGNQWGEESYQWGGGMSWPSGQLPITRVSQGLETVFKGTQLEWLGDIIGLGAKPEQLLRESRDLPEMGTWTDWYIGRQLSNLVIEGVVDDRTANVQLIEKKGEFYDMAYERVRLEMMAKVPGLSPLYAAMHGATLDKILESVIPSLFPGGIVPPAELEAGNLKQEYGLAWEAKANGNDDAINEFYEKHPEYNTRLAIRREPERQLTQHLTSEVWDSYQAAKEQLGPTDFRQLMAYVGPEFYDKMMSDEYEPTNEELIIWAKMFSGALETEAAIPDVPGTKITKPVPKVNYFSPETKAITDPYFIEKAERFPNIWYIEQEFWSLPKSERGLFLLRFPQLKEKWAFDREMRKKYPDLEPILRGTVFKRIDTSSWSPSVLNSVTNTALAGEPLDPGTETIMRQMYETNPDYQFYSTFEAWVENDVYPSILNQLEQESVQ